MGATGEFPSHLVSYRAHVGSRGDTGAEAEAVFFDGKDFEFPDFDLHRLQHDFFLLAGKLVCWDAFYFFCGEWGRSLFDDSAKARSQDFDFMRVKRDFLRGGGGVPVGVIGIGGEAETHGSFVGFLGGCVELGKAGEITSNEGKDSGGHGIEGAEVSDGALAENAAGAVDYVVRGKSGGLVDDEDGVHEMIG